MMKYSKARRQKKSPRKEKGLNFLYAVIGCFVFSFSLSIVGIRYWENREHYLKGNNILYPFEKVLGVQTAKTDLIIDYAEPSAKGNPEIFGGAHGPRDHHPEVWDTLKEAGVTSMKRDINLQYEAPLKGSVQGYIQTNLGKDNTQNFNLSRINETNSMFKNAKERGMKTMAVTAFMPPWLSQNGKNNGLPTNWDVYEDLIGKIYKIHRPYLDYLEISNEPDLGTFLAPPKGKTRQQAYLELFIHTSRAVRRVDQQINDGKFVVIGGGITSEPNQPSYLETLLKDPDAKNYIQFTSFHTYGYKEPTDARTRDVLKKYGVENLPIYISEWNKSSKTNQANAFHTADPAITFTAGKFIEFLNQGYAGASYFTMSENDPKRPNTVFSTYGIYQMKNNKPVIFPQVKTWEVLSDKSYLGHGKSDIYPSTIDKNTNLDVVSFKNAKGQFGFAVSNPTNTSYTIAVTMKNMGIKEQKKMVAYEASSTWESTAVKGSLSINLATQNRIQIFVPASSLVSVITE